MPRKGGPGITGSDLLVVNKVRLRGKADWGDGGGRGFADWDGQIDLAEAVGADLSVMERDAGRMR